MTTQDWGRQSGAGWRGARGEVVEARTVPLLVVAYAEMILEGWVHPDGTSPGGPIGDHPGYCNSVEPFPVMLLSAISTLPRSLVPEHRHRPPAGQTLGRKLAT
jgi:UbiD family decarboxylase